MPIATIAEIIQIAFPTVLAAMKGGRNWADPQLQALEDNFRIKEAPLGVFLQIEQPDHSFKSYGINEISIPGVWTMRDELLNQSESQRINLAKSLMENMIHSHDDLLLEKIGNNCAVVSRNYKYSLGAVQEIAAQNAYVVKLWTEVAIIDH